MTTLSTLLEVFPGWPESPEGAPLDWLSLLLFGPLALGLVIVLIFVAGRWREQMTDSSQATGSTTAITRRGQSSADAAPGSAGATASTAGQATPRNAS